jgi:hypothetical protein
MNDASTVRRVDVFAKALAAAHTTACGELYTPDHTLARTACASARLRQADSSPRTFDDRACIRASSM